MARERECLTVTARLGGPICLPMGALYLDALLVYAKALEEERPPALDRSMVSDDIEIPIAFDRVYLASVSQFEPDESELQYTNRRPPIEQYQTIGSPKMNTVQINLGAHKAYRIPRPVYHVRGDAIRWYVVGDAAVIRELLAHVTHLGKRRSVGLGRVVEWLVEPCETWVGFPCVRDGLPLRNLPTDWPGVDGARVGFGVLVPPYHDQTREELCLLPHRSY